MAEVTVVPHLYNGGVLFRPEFDGESFMRFFSCIPSTIIWNSPHLPRVCALKNHFEFYYPLSHRNIGKSRTVYTSARYCKFPLHIRATPLNGMGVARSLKTCSLFHQRDPAGAFWSFNVMRCFWGFASRSTQASIE